MVKKNSEKIIPIIIININVVSFVFQVWRHKLHCIRDRFWQKHLLQRTNKRRRARTRSEFDLLSTSMLERQVQSTIALQIILSFIDIVFYLTLLLVPISCARDRLWQVERIPGAVFMDSNAFHLPDQITRNQCYEKCIDTGKLDRDWERSTQLDANRPRDRSRGFLPGRNCESVQFRTTKPLSIDETALGRCSLSLHERGTRPSAYRASMYRDEYLRDQCRSLCKWQV